MGITPVKPFAVITGASSGIGYELAKQFAQNGFDILITSENHQLKEAQASLQDLGIEAQAIEVDLGSYEGVENLYGAIHETNRPVDAIAINPGTAAISGGFSRRTELDSELKLIQLNIASTVHLAKRIAKDMVRRAHGRILFTSSMAALMPAPSSAVNGAAKAFMHSFAEALRNELRDSGVSITELTPGYADVDFFLHAGMWEGAVTKGKKDDPAEIARDGFNALMAGDHHVAARSPKNKAQAILTKLQPGIAKAALHPMETEFGWHHRGQYSYLAGRR